jgi:hypothetical protein
MAQGFAAEVVGVLDGTLNPRRRPIAASRAEPCACYKATLDLALANVAKNNGDTNVLCRIPRGEGFLFGILNPSVGLGGVATVAIGNATTPASIAPRRSRTPPRRRKCSACRRRWMMIRSPLTRT